MTAPAPLDLPALLDDLERAHADATPGPWAQVAADDRYVIGDISDDGESYLDVADAESSADAAAIVTLHNAVPTLIAELRKRDAALRAVEALADEWQRGATRWEHPLPVPPQVAEVRAAVAAALSPESVTS